MKKQDIQISILEPCHEKWEEMTAVERGRFCGSCQKVVTDFTQMEDSEIIQFIKEGKGHCGRFSAAQLDRPLIPAIEKPRYFVIPFYKKIAASLLIMAAFAEKTFAQQKKQTSTQQQVTPIKKSKAPVIISGHLLDFETQKPIINTTVFLKKDSFELKSKTNKWGGFTFIIPENEQGGKGILSFGYYPLIDEEISLNQSNTKLILFCNEAEMLNEVVKTGYKEEVVNKNKFNDRIEGAIVWQSISTPIFNQPQKNLREADKKKRGTPKQIEFDELTNSKPSFWQRITHPFKRRTKN